MQDRRTAFRVRRAALNLTQMKAARAARIEINRFVRIENGVFDATDAERKRIAKVFKCNPADLFPEQVIA